jgi:hypothetical protein
VAAVALALLCLTPIVLVLASFVGAVPFDQGMLFLAFPALAIGVPAVLTARTAVQDLLLPLPVMQLDDEALFDRRVSDRPILWGAVESATSILEGGGGVVLELRSGQQTSLDSFRIGTFLFQQPRQGIAHVAVRGMTMSAATLSRAILDLAGRHGAAVSYARAHEKMPRLRWTV